MDTDIFLVYSPEREDPGNKNFSPSNIPKVIGGHTPACLGSGQAPQEKAMTKYSRISLALICFLTAFTPLARGSVHMWAVTLMQTGVMICIGLLIAESLRLKRPLIPDTPLTRPLAAAMVLAFISMIRSEHPAQAVEGFLLLLTYAATYFIVRSAVRTRQEQRILVSVIIGTAVFLSVFGLFKRFGANPFSFWQYDDLKYPATFLSATFGNHNHLAGFLEMALPFLLALFLTRSKKTSTISVLVYLVLILLTVLAMSLSRGGWLATAVSLCFMGSVLLSRRGFGNKKLIIGIGTAVLVISVIVLAATPVVERVMTLSEQDPAANMGGRLTAYSGTLNLIRDHLLTGTGPGTYAVAFPGYQPPGLGALYDHAHNDYLEFISDTGIGVIPVLIWILVILFRTGFRLQSHPSRQARGISLAVMTAVVAILVHSTGDFNLQIPSNAFLFTVIIANMALIPESRA